MYLLGHNAKMTQIVGPATPADPTAGIAGQAASVRWSGSVEAYIDEDIVDEVKGGMRIQISQTILDLPANVPVLPNIEDQVTVVRSGVLVRFGNVAPQQEILIVRKFDGGLVMLGKVRLVVVRT